MLRHNLIIAYRSFLRNKSSFLINLIGLSTGLSCLLLIFLWVNDELSVDRFHEKDEQLYQVMQHFELPSGIQTWDFSPSLLANAVAEDLPEVELAVNVNQQPEGIISTEDNQITADGIYAGSKYFDVFSYTLIKGNSKNILTDNTNIVLSEALALKLFSSLDGVLGKTVKWKSRFSEQAFLVSGVYKNPPANATAQFDFIVPFDLLIDGDKDVEVWSDGYAATYLVLQKGTDIDGFGSKITSYIQSKSIWWNSSTFFVQQFSKKYLHSKYEAGVLVGGRIEYVRLFSIIAIFILLIACINFMNLSTAQASRKMKEIGVKKSIGANRGTLIMQFLSESLLMAFLSLLIAVVIVSLLLSQFNEITGKQLQLSASLGNMLAILGIVSITGLLAGSYPALYLSGFQPLAILKGKLNSSTGEVWVRKGLVIFQFALSLIFIVGILVINQQMEFIQTKNLGYDRNNVISFEMKSFEDDPAIFISELKNFPGVANASNMTQSILTGAEAQSGFSWSGAEADEDFLFKSPQIGLDAIETLDMEIVAGRSFSKAHNDDDSKIIINETAMKMMQLDDPIGKRVGKNLVTSRADRQIIGVVKDFHYGSIHHKVEPLIFRLRDYGRNILVKIKAGTEKATLSQIEALYQELYPEYAFEYTFLDNDYQALYQSESKVATLSKYFGAFAILISCLGLFGLVAFTAERRNKEIGVRKILGATLWGIVSMLSRDFTRLVLLGILFALPVSYLIASKWLDNFAYKIDLNWWFFAGAAGLTLLIAWITVGIQTLRAAKVNLVESLKSE